MSGEKRRELRQARLGLTRAERIRMGWMGAVLVMAIVLWVRLFSGGNLPGEREARPTHQDALLSLPRLDPAALEGVKDSTSGERVILEPDAFKSLALHAQTLFPDHLEALGELVRAQVWDSQGVKLRWEVRRIGRIKPPLP